MNPKPRLGGLVTVLIISFAVQIQGEVFAGSDVGPSITTDGQVDPDLLAFGRKCPPCCQDRPKVTAEPAKPAKPESRPEVTPDQLPATIDEDMLASSFDAPAAPGSIAPNMLGDISGFQPIYQQLFVETRYKVADNTSPMPRSRVFGGFHRFSDILNSRADVNRGVGGFEHAFFGDRMSVEFRTSLNGFDDSALIPTTEFGNLVTTFKGLLYSNGATNLSGGLSVQWQTSPANIVKGNHILSPFFGFLYMDPSSGFFVHGFEELDIPSNSDDQVLLQSSVGIGAWLFEGALGSLITRMAPTAELHLYTPIGDDPSGSLGGLFVYRDVLNLTLGATVMLGQSATLAVGYGLPLSHKKDYDNEIQILFNWFYGGSLR